jgi:hypothetical protein
VTRWLLMASIALASVPASPAQDIAGSWRGTLRMSFLGAPSLGSAIGGARRQGVSSTAAEREASIVVKFAKDRHGTLAGSLYDANNVARVFPLWAIFFDGSKLSFTLQQLPFTGTLSDDRNFISGWFQGTVLRLSRVDRVETEPPPAAKPDSAPSTDPSALLARALERLSGTTRRLLKYTCLQTVDRTYYSDPPANPDVNPIYEAPASSCNKKEFSHGGNLVLDAEDRLRLEVAVSGGKEIHSWPAASRFDTRSVFDLISTGPMLSGAFGTTVVDIFENPGTQYRFTGVKREGVFEYDFEVAPDVSHYSIKAGADWKITGYRGSFEIDAATAGLGRLVVETDELPIESGMCRARTDTTYHYAQIGDGRFLLPLKSEFDTLSPNQSETRNLISFSACHEFTAESNLVSDDSSSPSASKSAAASAAPLPPGVELTLALLSPIDTGTAAAGDSISAKITKAVHATGSNETLVPAGALARGRILQLRHQYRSGDVQILIRFDTLDRDGVVSPLSVRLDRDLKPAGARTKEGFASRGTEFSLAPPSSDHAGWFNIPAAGARYVMPAGFESKWITVAP